MTRPHVTAVTGGIGSGKSVVCRILGIMGYPVYDCDSRAREIMDHDTDIHAQLCRHIHPEAVRDGVPDRSLISSIVFRDPEALRRLNKIVHTRLVDDFRAWAQSQTSPRVFIESAILDACPALWPLLDDAWEVVAPTETRIARVMGRNGLSREQVEARIAAQGNPAWNISTRKIENSGLIPLLPQIHKLLGAG